MYREFIEIRNEKTKSLERAKKICIESIQAVLNCLDDNFGVVTGCSLRLGDAIGNINKKNESLMPLNIISSNDKKTGDIIVMAKGTIVLSIENDDYPVFISAKMGIYNDDSAKIEVPSSINIEDGSFKRESICYKNGDDKKTLAPIIDAIIEELKIKIKLK